MPAMLYRGGQRRFRRRLFEQRLDELREAVACPVEAAFHRSQVATRDVRNLGVALPLELPQYEHRPFAVPDRAVNEIEQPGLIAVDQGAERLMVAGQVFEHHLAIVELVKRLALQRAGGDGGLCLPFEGCSHKTGSVVSARNDPGTSETSSCAGTLSHEPYPSPGDFTAASLSGKTTTCSRRTAAGCGVDQYRPPEVTLQRDGGVTGPSETLPYKG